MSDGEPGESATSLGIPAIQFGVLGDGNSIEKHTVSFNRLALARVQGSAEGVAHYTPKPVSIDKLLDFLKASADYKESETASRLVYENSAFSLEVYPNGNFCLFSKENEEGQSRSPFRMKNVWK